MSVNRCELFTVDPIMSPREAGNRLLCHLSGNANTHSSYTSLVGAQRAVQSPATRTRKRRAAEIAREHVVIETEG